MKSAMFTRLEHMEIVERPEPVCGPDEAVLQVEACGVCGSDVRLFHYGNDRVSVPAVVGHEIAGVVAKVGANVDNLREGDRVAIGADVPCGTCYWCTNGMGTNCRINYAIGHQFEGGFQQQMVLNATTLRYGPVTPIPDSLGFAEAAIAEPLACAINGLELAQFKPGKSLCIIGLGPIGCMMLELSRVFGASKVFAAQRSRTRLEMARRFRPDARFVCIEDEDLQSVVMEETGGEGVDCVVTTAGTVQSHEQAIAIVGHRGYVNLFGGLKNQPKLTIDSNIIHYRECFVMGSHGSLPRHHRIAIEMLAREDVHATYYISKRFSLDDLTEAIAFHESRAGLKVVVEPNGANG